MDSMGCIIGIEAAIEELGFVEPKWLKVPGIGFGELVVAELGRLATARLRQLATDSFELQAIGNFGQLVAIGLEQLVAIELERLAFDIVGFAELIEPMLLSTAGAVLNTEHIIEHKHSVDTVEHTVGHRAVTSEHFTIDTERIARHITVVRCITEHTITTSSVHKPTTIMAELQQEFIAIAVSHRTIVDTIIATASDFGIVIDSTVAIAERMEIGID